MAGESFLVEIPASPAVEYRTTGGAPGALPPGTQAARPSASGLADGITRFSTDYRGGTQYTVSAGSWVQSAPSGDDVGGVELAAATPETFGGWTSTANTWRRVPELTTPAFTMPAGPIMCELGNVGLVFGAASAVKVALAFTTDGGTTWRNFGNWAPSAATVSSLSAVIVSRLPTGQGSAPAAGATVQVAAQVRLSTGSVAVVPLIGDNAFGTAGDNWWPSLTVRTV